MDSIVPVIIRVVGPATLAAILFGQVNGIKDMVCLNPEINELPEITKSSHAHINPVISAAGCALHCSEKTAEAIENQAGAIEGQNEAHGNVYCCQFNQTKEFCSFYRYEYKFSGEKDELSADRVLVKSQPLNGLIKTYATTPDTTVVHASAKTEDELNTSDKNNNLFFTEEDLGDLEQ